MDWGLTQEDIDKIKSVLKKYDAIEEVVIYGSRAKGNYQKGSDIDLTLVGYDISLKTLNSLANDLDDLLLPYLFDLSVFSHIKNQELIHHIQRVGKPIYQKKSDES